MDKIEFIPRTSAVEDYQVIDVFINGFNLINIISTEEQSLFPAMHISAYPGLYEGIPPTQCLPPKRHFWGIAEPIYQIMDKRVSVLESSRSGIPAEWTISVHIEVDGEKVTWRDFRHEQLGFFYKKLPAFEFELVAYRNAIAAALGDG